MSTLRDMYVYVDLVMELSSKCASMNQDFDCMCILTLFSSFTNTSPLSHLLMEYMCVGYRCVCISTNLFICLIN